MDKNSTEIWSLLRNMLSELLGLTLEEPSSNIGLDLIPEWDSLSQAEVIEALEETFDIEVSNEDFGELITVSRIFEYLQENYTHVEK